MQVVSVCNGNWKLPCGVSYLRETRMHSSRMHTAGSSSCSGRGGVWSWSPWISPLGMGLNLIPLNLPLGCGPGSDPPQFLPWVWAWIWSPLISPLGVGLDLIPLNFPLGCGSWPDPPQFSPWMWAWRGDLLGRGVSLVGGSPWQGGLLVRGVSLAGGSPSMHRGRPPCGQTHTCKNIAFANYVCGR